MTRVLDSVADESLAELCDELAGRLHAGEPLDADSLPESLRDLLPALHALVEVRGSSASPERERREIRPVARAPGWLEPMLGKLGDFRLLREIGRGGMGVVYEAEQISLGRRVALKVLPFAAALNPRQLQRFRSEAQAAASLHHPNVVPVYAVGCEQGVHYYAMQLIDGQTLADAIAQTRRAAGLDGAAASPDSTVLAEAARPAAVTKGSCPSGTVHTAAHSHGDRAYFRRVAELTAQAAEALDYAHQLGVVHRDVKPANLMVDGRGGLWVTDFGLVRYAHDAGLTVSGELLGTLRYMSPEQATAKRGVVDHRTDVYALGATLYELLTLRPVFATESRGDLIGQIVRDDPTPPRRLNRAVPAELETVVLKALAKSPEGRYATAQEFADDLRRFLADRPVLARRPGVAERVRRWAWRHRSVAVGVAAAAVFAAICLGASGACVCCQRDEIEHRRVQARQAVDKMYAEVAEKWLAHQPHLQPLQREYLRRALEFYEGFAREGGCKPCARLEAGKALLRVADIRAKLGEPAEETYAAAIERFRELPAVPEARVEYAVALNHRGNLRRSRGRPCEALRDYQEAEAQFARLVGERPDDAECRAGLAGSRVNVGLARYELHAFAEAEAAYRQALPLFEELTRADPAAPNHRHDLAGCVNNLGLVLQDTGRLGPAEEAFARAAALWKALAAGPDNIPPYRRAAATNLANLAFVYAATGRAAQADAAYRESQALRERLATDFPLVVAYRQELAATLHGRGTALTAAGKAKEAERLLREAFAQRTPLAAAYPGVPAHQRDLAASHHAFGDLLAATGKRAAAEQAYRAALTLRERLAGECPTPVHAAELTATRTALERVRAAAEGE